MKGFWRNILLSLPAMALLFFRASSPEAARFPVVVEAGSPTNIDIDYLFGEGTEFRSGTALAAGDFNDDGLDDLAVGSPYALDGAGCTYIVFGVTPHPDSLHLADPGVPVVKLTGGSYLDWSGSSLAAGDVNGDGCDDLIIGAYRADPAGRTNAGKAYVVFGDASLHLETSIALDATSWDILRINGGTAEDAAGFRVAAANANGDGFDDIVVGVPKADPLGRPDAGEIALIFGSAALKTAPDIDLATYTGMVRIAGESSLDETGQALAFGDMDGDGIDEIGIGSLAAQDGYGGAYLVSGYSLIDTLSVYDLADPPTERAVKMFGPLKDQRFGTALAMGDFNGNGYVDLAVGAAGEDPAGRTDAGTVRVMFGASDVMTSGTYFLSQSQPPGMLTIDGAPAAGMYGTSLAAGDPNNDGYDDIIAGSPKASPGGRTEAGGCVILWGRSTLHLRGGIDLAVTPDVASTVRGGAAGDNLGTAVVVLDSDGDNIGDLFAGMPMNDNDGVQNAGGIVRIGGYWRTDIVTRRPGFSDYVEGSAVIECVFNSPMSSVTFDVYESERGTVDGATTIQGETASFTSTEPFSVGSWVRVTVQGINSDGQSVSQESWLFNIKGDSSPPVILAQSPGSGEMNVDPATDIVVTFSGDAEPDSTVVTVTGEDGLPVAMTESWSDSTLTLGNPGTFELDGTVDVTVDVGDLYGDRNHYAWSFGIRPETTPPYFDFTVPHGTSLMAAGDSITVMFPGDVNTSSVATVVEGSFSGVVQGTWRWAGFNRTFIPTAPYHPGETLLLRVSAEDIHRNGYTDSTVVLHVRPDEVPPALVDRYPGPGAVVGDPDADLQLEFSDDVVRDSTAVHLTSALHGTVSATASWDQYALTLDPVVSFSLGDTLTVSVEAGDAYANRMTDEWTFTVKPDITPPYFTLRVPGDPSLMGWNDTISLVFPGDVDTATVETALTAVPSQSVPGSWAWQDTVYTFTPGQPYPAGVGLNLTVSASDVHANAIPDTTLHFTVKPDETPPSIVSRTPAVNATGVSRTSPLTIEFTADVVPDSTTVSLTSLSRGALSVTTSWNNRILTIHHAQAFLADETLNVTLDTGDIYGNRDHYGWYFSSGDTLAVGEFTVSIPGDPEMPSLNSQFVVVPPDGVDVATIEVAVTGSESGTIDMDETWLDGRLLLTPATLYQPGEQLVVEVSGRDGYGNLLPSTVTSYIVAEHAPWVTIDALEPHGTSPRTYRITYTVNDPDNNYTVTRNWRYSLDGATWTTVAESAVTGNPSRAPGTHEITWTLTSALSGAYSDSARFRMEVYDGRFGSGLRTSDMFTLDWNQPPSVVVRSVEVDYDAGIAEVDYTISDVERNPVSLLFGYSTDGGVTWRDVAPDTTLAAIPYGAYSGTYEWPYGDELAAGTDYREFMVRLTPHDFKDGTPGVSDTLEVDLNEPPVVELADIYTVQSGDVSVAYSVSDAEDDTLQFACYYSTDGGTNWTATDNVTGTSDISPGSGTVVWQSKRDVGSIQTLEALFRVVPWDDDAGLAADSGPFQLVNNGPPQVVVSLPDTAGVAIPVAYTVTDPENDPVSLHLQWSQEGTVWHGATVTGDTLSVGSDAYRDTLYWQSKSDTGEGLFTAIRFRLSATDASNPPGSSGVISDEHTLAVDNRPPHLAGALQFAGSDTVHFSFDEPVAAETVLANETLVLPPFTVLDVRKKSDARYFLVFDPEGQAQEPGTLSITGVADRFGNLSGAVGVPVEVDDGNENPLVTLDALPDTVSGAVDVGFYVTDAESDTVSVQFSYSTNGGSTWLPATMSGETAGIGPDGYDGTVVWQSALDLPGAANVSVSLRAIADDGDSGVPAITEVFTVYNNQPPTVALAVDDPDSVYSDSVTIGYTLSDAENDILSLGVEYSTDDGLTWDAATLHQPLVGIGPAAYDGAFTWLTANDLPETFARALVRAVPADMRRGEPDSLYVWVDNFGACRSYVTLPSGEQTGDITVTYTITDHNDRPVTLTPEFSPDGGSSWEEIATDADLTDLDAGEYGGTFLWNSRTQLAGVEGVVSVRLVPDNGVTGIYETGTVYVDYNEPPAAQFGGFPEEIGLDVTIPFTLNDDEGDDVSVQFEYTVDNGTNWYDLDLAGETTGLAGDGTEYEVVWHSYNDLPGWEIENLRIRITPSDADSGGSAETDDLHLDNNLPPDIVISTDYPDSTYTDSLRVDYALTDTENNMVALDVRYSLDDGASYSAATVDGKTSAIFSSGYNGSLVWLLDEDVEPGAGTARLKITPADRDSGTPDSLEVSYNTYGLCTVTLAAPSGEQTGDVPIDYTVTDEKGLTVDLGVRYSTDGGAEWRQATVTGQVTGLEPSSYTGTFTWEAGADLPGYEGTAVLSAVPDNGTEGTEDRADIHLDFNQPPSIREVQNQAGEEYSGQASIFFIMDDAENNNGSVTFSYTTDGGTTFEKASYSGGTWVKPGVVSEIRWHTSVDLGVVYRQEVYLRFVPADADTGQAVITGPYTVTNMAGDYTFDGSIDSYDLPYFADAWNRQDTTKELAPATGTVPNLTVTPDGIVDFEDLAVFIMMWNWYSEQNPGKPALPAVAAKNAADVGSAALLHCETAGDGTLAVTASAELDYLGVFVEPAEDAAFTVQSHLDGGEGNVLLSRSYDDRVWEVAAASFGNNAAALGTARPLNIAVEGYRGDLRMYCRYRRAGGSVVQETVLSVASDELYAVPKTHHLYQNTPNPFNPATTISFALPHDTHVRLVIRNIAGQVVEVLKDAQMPAGSHSMTWQAADRPSGQYFITLETHDYSRTRKMLLLK